MQICSIEKSYFTGCVSLINCHDPRICVPCDTEDYGDNTNGTGVEEGVEGRGGLSHAIT